MVPTRTGKPGKMGRHFPIREKSGNFTKTRKVREFYLKYWKNQEKLDWKFEKKYWKSPANLLAVIVKTMQIRYHTLNNKKAEWLMAQLIKLH